MTTKEQERKALERIKKIVAELGEDSYVATAFEGCFEIAEENIENDFACSMKQRAESAEKRETEKSIELSTMNSYFTMMRDERDAANKDAEEWHNRYDKAVNSMNTYHDESIKNWNMFREQEDKAIALEEEIVRLKAKLYDLIVK